MSPTLSGSLALQCVKLGDVLEIRNRIIFDFYSGLPHVSPTLWFTQTTLVLVLRPQSWVAIDHKPQTTYYRHTVFVIIKVSLESVHIASEITTCMPVRTLALMSD